MVKTLDNIAQAKNLWEKTVGVIGWKDFGNKNGLLLTGTSSIHTFFVRFPLDLVFLDKKNEVIEVIKSLKPFRISPIVWKASSCLEMPTGSIERFSLQKGDKLNFK